MQCIQEIICPKEVTSLPYFIYSQKLWFLCHILLILFLAKFVTFIHFIGFPEHNTKARKVVFWYKLYMNFVFISRHIFCKPKLLKNKFNKSIMVNKNLNAIKMRSFCNNNKQWFLMNSGFFMLFCTFCTIVSQKMLLIMSWIIRLKPILNFVRFWR